MSTQKSVSALVALFCFIAVSALFISCSGSGDTKVADSDTSAAMEPATIAPAMDSAAMEMDTTLLDSASTRPVKNPNKKKP